MLGLFPPGVAGALGPWIPRIALAIGPMRTSRPDGSGDPDGFAGLARRGSYERLLLTEWLLADEAPEEFARRAAMGEHAFFQLARRSPAKAANSVVIVDAGPDPIGAPPIAGLAALIVLAERAERAGARFAWGVLHDPGGALAQAVTREGVRRMLAARTGVPACAEDVAAWADRARKSGWEDAWIVGPGALPGPWPHATLEVRDVLDPSRRALSLVARSPGAPPREIDLDLPPQDACVRLLRDPFAAPAPPTTRVQQSDRAPIGNLLFSANGAKLLARSTDGDIVYYPVPASPQDLVGRPKRYRRRKAQVFAGAGWIARGLVTLSITESALVFKKTTPRGPDLLDSTVPRPKGLPIAAPGPADPLSPVFCLCPEARTLVFFLDARRALFLVKADPEPRVTCIATEVTAIASFAEQVAYVGRMEGGPPSRHRPGDTLPPMTVPEALRPLGARGGERAERVELDRAAPGRRVLRGLLRVPGRRAHRAPHRRRAAARRDLVLPGGPRRATGRDPTARGHAGRRRLAERRARARGSSCSRRTTGPSRSWATARPARCAARTRRSST